MGSEIPRSKQPRVSTEQRMEQVKIQTSQRHGGNCEPPAKKKPERQAPSEILERPVIAKPKEDRVGHADRGANFRAGMSIFAQPNQHQNGRDRD